MLNTPAEDELLAVNVVKMFIKSSSRSRRGAV
jgi:hypothetical protein